MSVKFMGDDMRFHFSKKDKNLEVEIIDSSKRIVLKAVYPMKPDETLELTCNGSMDFSVCPNEHLLPDWMGEPFETDAVYHPGHPGNSFSHVQPPWYGCRECGRSLGKVCIEKAPGVACPHCGVFHTIRPSRADGWYFARGRDGVPVRQQK